MQHFSYRNTMKWIKFSWHWARDLLICRKLIESSITLNRWSGDNGDDGRTESPGSWEPDRTHIIKWTAEGAGKGMDFRVFCDVRAYVSCREYVGIPKRARDIRITAEDFVKQGGTAGDKANQSSYPVLGRFQIIWSLSWTGFLFLRFFLSFSGQTDKKRRSTWWWRWKKLKSWQRTKPTDAFRWPQSDRTGRSNSEAMVSCRRNAAG